jgi:hypothetical protein
MIRLVSNTPSGPSAAVPLVAVCGAVSVFEKVTVPPAEIVAVVGE